MNHLAAGTTAVGRGRSPRCWPATASAFWSVSSAWSGWCPSSGGLIGHARREQPYTRPEHLRLALEELGPAFVKLGQILSTRADLLPPEYQAELAHLQDQVPPEPWERIRTVIQEEVGRPPRELFAEVAPEPLAAAPIGQAHLGRLASGEAVVVKVRRPGWWSGWRRTWR